MSRIGRLPITIPAGVTVTQDNDVITVKGVKGELTFKLHAGIKVNIVDGQITVERFSDDNFNKAMHGMVRAMIANMIEGVSKGFEKKLEVVGVGFKVQKSGEKLEFGLGFSHPVKVSSIEGIKMEIDPENKMVIVISGIDKQKVGEQAARIRAIKKPEPYKGKGIKYIDERIHRKAGKTAGAGAK
ncbi:MAG: 50S ribosomal protein L6 [Patescibacteria group bacterium]|nr:50S ribosomal protein L6 [Patescibacteria group bacterium]